MTRFQRDEVGFFKDEKEYYKAFSSENIEEYQRSRGVIKGDGKLKVTLNMEIRLERTKTIVILS